MLTSSASTDRRLLRFRSLGNTFPCRGGVGWVVSLPWVGSDAGDPHAAAKSSMGRRMGDRGWGGQERTQSLPPSPGDTFPCWVQSGGSSCPRGRRPLSRQDRKDSRWPPCGKCSGGLWMPSWLTSTSVPPLSGGERVPVRLGGGPGARGQREGDRRSVGHAASPPSPLRPAQTRLTLLMAVDADDLTEGHNQGVVPVDTAEEPGRCHCAPRHATPPRRRETIQRIA